MRVQILTIAESHHDRKLDELIADVAGDKFINWNDSSDRKWLVNHQHWALNNGYAVTVRPINPLHDSN